MIPAEVAELAEIICKGWSDLPDQDRSDVLAIAWNIYNAGFRKTKAA